MAAKLLAALTRITLEDVIPGRPTTVAAIKSRLNRSEEKAAADAADAAAVNPEGRESPFDESRHCKLCGLKFNSEEQLGQHLKGKRHEKSLRRTNLSASDTDSHTMSGIDEYGYAANNALQEMGHNASDPVTKALIGNITGTLPRKRVLDIIRCDVCSIDFNEKGQYQMHIDGKKHAKRQKLHDLIVSPPPSVQAEVSSADGEATGEDGQPKILSADGLNCFVCNISVNSTQMMDTHLNGSKHKSKMTRVSSSDIVKSAKAVAEKKKADGGPPSTAVEEGAKLPEATASTALHCATCNISANSAQQWEQHIQSKKHKDKLNPKPPPPPSNKIRGVGKPRINFVKGTSSDPNFPSAMTTAADMGGGPPASRGGPAGRGRGGGPPGRGRGRGWMPGGRGRGRGAPRGGGGYDNYGQSYESYHGGNGQSYGSYHGGNGQSYDGGNGQSYDGGNGQSYESYHGGNNAAYSTPAPTAPAASQSYHNSGYSAYPSNSYAGDSQPSANAGGGGDGSHSGEASSAYGGGAYSASSDQPQPQQTSDMYKVTPSINATFVKGNTLKSNYYY